ncbi:glial cell line-derived neurotrophic factor isoform X1 [Trichomycterus rosablanca]|uniref:glial cell line-derived neurotrophic factor isoform X1 n=1 Tax=Trichomycterus rosablanca TaxID=2290929 RepID=UPI002F36102E
MKLWDVLATCLLLLSSVSARPLSVLSVLDDITGLHPDQFDDVMDFITATIGRLRRSSDMELEGKRGRGKQKGAANRKKGRGRGRGGGRAGKGDFDDLVKGQSRGCLLKEIHLNVTDLGLGYQTKEELIFRYCSGPCFDSETNYDKILNNLTQNKKLDKDSPSQTCCRPIAFDDDLSFLDDNLEYHTLKKHSAKKCACI